MDPQCPTIDLIQNNGADDENRTHNNSLEGCGFTTKLHPHISAFADKKNLERKTRFELATLALARRCSTPEPLPHKNFLVEGDGFEPSKAQLTDLQSAPFGHSGIPRDYWSWWRESNPQPADYKSAALPLSHTSILNWRSGTGSNRRPPA